MSNKNKAIQVQALIRFAKNNFQIEAAIWVGRLSKKRNKILTLITSTNMILYSMQLHVNLQNLLFRRAEDIIAKRMLT